MYPLSFKKFFSICQNDDLIVLDDPIIVHLVHGPHKTCCQGSQSHAREKLEEEAVEEHVEAEQEVTPVQTWNLVIRNVSY